MITTEEQASTTEDTPWLRLAIATVEQALCDVQTYATALRRAPSSTYWQNELPRLQREAQDARHFLLVRLQEPDNPFGLLLAAHGARAFTKARLIHCSRTVGSLK